MPIYEYKCEKCGHITEQLRSMSTADEPVACESCQGKKTARVQSVFAANSGGAGAVPDCCPVGPMTGGGCCGGMCKGH